MYVCVCGTHTPCATPPHTGLGIPVPGTRVSSKFLFLGTSRRSTPS